MHYEADILVPCTWSFRAEGLDMPSGFGVEGGAFGAVGEQWVEPAGGDRFIPPKYGVRQLPPSRIIGLTPGGGGWGNPLARPPELVLRDVRDGVVSRSGAERDYGVVITEDGSAIDEVRTEALRARRRG